jgi:cell division protein FtsL
MRDGVRAALWCSALLNPDILKYQACDMMFFISIMPCGCSVQIDRCWARPIDGEKGRAKLGEDEMNPRVKGLAALVIRVGSAVSTMAGAHHDRTR